MSDDKKNTLPTLTRRRLVSAIKAQVPGFPLEVVQAASRIILERLSANLEEGRPIALRGFGSFQVRRYANSSKKLGIIFRPSPELLTRVNKRLTEASEAPKKGK
mgnify:FL=1